MDNIGKIAASCNKGEENRIYMYGSLHIFEKGHWVEREIKRSVNRGKDKKKKY